jgi:hypothetical protein
MKSYYKSSENIAKKMAKNEHF